jgi:RNA polymerase sigma-70 factor (ECF subfamily)
MGDAELVGEALAGRQGSFEALARKYARLVASIAMARLGRPQELDDVLQEVFMRAWANLATLKDRAKFSSWVYGITKWVCSERIQERKPLPLPEEQPFAFEPSPEAEDRRAEVLHAVEKLPEIYRETIALLYFEELSYEDISRTLGISKAAVNFRLTRARAMLRKELSKVRGETR